jgi:hypothetical protein
MWGNAAAVRLVSKARANSASAAAACPDRGARAGSEAKATLDAAAPVLSASKANPDPHSAQEVVCPPKAARAGLRKAIQEEAVATGLEIGVWAEAEASAITERSEV